MKRSWRLTPPLSPKVERLRFPSRARCSIELGIEVELELFRRAIKGEHGLAPAELGPASLRFERRERSGREPFDERAWLGREPCRELVQARIVANQQDAADRLGQFLEALEQLARRGEIEL